MIDHWWEERKEGNVLFNDILNTLYLQLYGIGHLVKNHTDSERGNPLPPYGLLFQGFCSMHHPTERKAHTMAFVTPVVGALAGMRNSLMGSP